MCSSCGAKQTTTGCPLLFCADVQLTIWSTHRALLTALQPCTNLVCLHLLDQSVPHGYASHWLAQERFDVSPLASISCLQKLQELVISWPTKTDASFLPALPPSLTHLGLIGSEVMTEYECSSDRSEPLVLQQLPHLRALRIKCLHLSDETLRNMTNLQFLHLKECTHIRHATFASMTQLQKLVLHRRRVRELVESILVRPSRLHDLGLHGSGDDMHVGTACICMVVSATTGPTAHTLSRMPDCETCLMPCINSLAVSRCFFLVAVLAPLRAAEGGHVQSKAGQSCSPV